MVDSDHDYDRSPPGICSGTPPLGRVAAAYTVQPLHEGSTLTCAVTATNAGGPA